MIVFAIQDEGLAIKPGELDDSVLATLAMAAARNKFTGARDKLIAIAGLVGLGADCAMIVGLGPRAEIGPIIVEDAAARAFAAVADREFEQIKVLASAFDAELAAHAALGVALGSYRFDKYHTVKKTRMPVLLSIVTSDIRVATSAHKPLTAIAAGVRVARDLVSEPPNILYPASFAERLSVLEEKGVEIAVLDEEGMAKLGMGLLLAVGQGSARESRLVTMRWSGAGDKDVPPLVLVGKGVTFDSGGLSLKPGKDMEQMKQDMGGAAAVAGALLVLAERRAAANVVGVLGLVENMPDGNAYRPGDILTSMSGQTVEIINTDAEGRLVLADALWYAQAKLGPAAIVDLATLTGHASYALGNDYAALLSNDDVLSGRIIDAGAGEGEPIWRLPLVSAYDKLHDTPDADMKHVGGHPEAGAITAALFLQRFVNGAPWAHLDIASVAWRAREDRPTLPKGATGYGVRTLNRLVAEHFEKRN